MSTSNRIRSILNTGLIAGRDINQTVIKNGPIVPPKTEGQATRGMLFSIGAFAFWAVINQGKENEAEFRAGSFLIALLFFFYAFHGYTIQMRNFSAFFRVMRGDARTRKMLAAVFFLMVTFVFAMTQVQRIAVGSPNLTFTLRVAAIFGLFAIVISSVCLVVNKCRWKMPERPRLKLKKEALFSVVSGNDGDCISEKHANGTP